MYSFPHFSCISSYHTIYCRTPFLSLLCCHTLPLLLLSSLFPFIAPPSHCTLQHWWRTWVFSSCNPHVCHTRFYVRSSVVRFEISPQPVQQPPLPLSPPPILSSFWNPLPLVLSLSSPVSLFFVSPPTSCVLLNWTCLISQVVRVCWPHTSYQFLRVE